jgi:hypothetical protein
VKELQARDSNLWKVLNPENPFNWDPRALRALDEGHGIKGDYSSDLRFNVIFCVGFWTYLRPVTLFITFGM